MQRALAKAANESETLDTEEQQKWFTSTVHEQVNY